MDQSAPYTPRRFPTTRWSLVDRAKGDGAGHGRAALEELLEQYLPAMRAFLACGRHVPPHQLDDLLQGFVSSEVLERHLLRRADRARGTFRALLLTALKRYVSRDRRRRGARKRGPERAASLEGLAEPASRGGRRPVDVFEVAWAQQVIAQAVARTRHECESARRDDLWAVLEARVLAHALDGAEPLGYGELIRRFGFASPRQASNALITAKRMFVRHLREVVGEYAPGEQADAEIADLRRVLATAGAAAGTVA